MDITLKLTIQPFYTPRIVKDTENREYALSTLDSKSLDTLCEDFRRSVFEEAGVKELAVGEPVADYQIVANVLKAVSTLPLSSSAIARGVRVYHSLALTSVGDVENLVKHIYTDCLEEMARQASLGPLRK